MRAATTHSAGTTLFTFTALKWTIATIQGVPYPAPTWRHMTDSAKTREAGERRPV